MIKITSKLQVIVSRQKKTHHSDGLDSSGGDNRDRTQISNNSELPMLLNTYSKAYILVHAHLYLYIGNTAVQTAVQDLI